MKYLGKFIEIGSRLDGESGYEGRQEWKLLHNGLTELGGVTQKLLEQSGGGCTTL